MTTTQQPDTLETLKSALAERHAERLRAILKQAPPHELGCVLDELSIGEQAAVTRLLGDEYLSSLLATGKPDDAVEATASALEKQQNRLRRFLRMLGPGLVTGASDDDPSGVATYAIAGASFGFATLWTALRPIAGDAASFLLALGLIGTGFLAVPVLTGSAAYAVAETFSWRYGLGERLSRARRFYALIVVSTLVGTLINFLGVNPIEALFWTAVINGLLAPPLFVLIVLVANNPAIMGRRRNGVWLNLLGWMATVLMFAAAFGLALSAGV
jgi:Mn2+/Fe2+ NRAMP family transporter